MDWQRVVRVRRASSDNSGSRYRFGSGYLFAEGRVLTAAHVLVPPDVRADVPDDLLVLTQRVVQPGDQCEVALWDTLKTAPRSEDIRWIIGNVEALDEQLDVAVIDVPEGEAGLERVTFGRLEGDQPVAWTAVGFPLAGKDDAGRQPEQAWGLVAPLTAAFSGGLGLTVDSRHARPGSGGDSGWAGLSGAAVFVGSSLVGVIVEDSPGFIGSLTARRIENAIASPKLASALTGLHVTGVSAKEPGLGIDLAGYAAVVGRRSHIPAEYISWLTSRMFRDGDFQAKAVRDRLAEEVCHNWQIDIRYRPDDPQVDLHVILTKIFQQPDGQGYFEALLPTYIANTACRAHLTDYARDLAALVELRPLLAQVDFDLRELHRCYTASLHDQQRARDVDSLEEALRDLLDFVPSRRTPWRPICGFVARIARLRESEALHAWVENHEADPVSRNSLYAALDREDDEAVHYIVVDVPSPKADKIEFWLFDCKNLPLPLPRSLPCPVTAARLVDAVALLARSAVNHFKNVRYEILLPEAMLSSDVDQWPCDFFEGTYPLGERHALAVRWRERAHGELRPPWRAFAARLEATRHELPKLKWLEPGLPPTADLHEKVTGGELGDCLAFQFLPFAAEPQAPHALLKAALAGGMAYGIWLRRDPPDWQAFREDLAMVFSGRDLEEVPERIKEARRNKAENRDPESPFRNLTLFWDDPRRDPWGEKLTQPRQRR